MDICRHRLSREWCPACSGRKTVANSELNDLLYSHADMVRLCDEAKADQRLASAQAIVDCKHDESNEYVLLEEAQEIIIRMAV